MLTIPRETLWQYDLVTRFNSPYVAHDRGHAVDLYPPTTAAPSPVSGTVIGTRTVDAPPQPYATDSDHLILIKTESPRYQLADGDQAIARVMHVSPEVTAGERVTAGQTIGQTIRSGFFAPWVDDHLHVGFRKPETNLMRATGSLPLELAIDVQPLAWNGTGTVVETGATYAVLDTPHHPAPGDRFAAIGTDTQCVALDGGIPHFERGGAFGEHPPAVTMLGAELEFDADGTVPWETAQVIANGAPILGLSLFAARTDRVGARLICPDREFAIGEQVTLQIV